MCGNVQFQEMDLRFALLRLRTWVFTTIHSKLGPTAGPEEGAGVEVDVQVGVEIEVGLGERSW